MKRALMIPLMMVCISLLPGLIFFLLGDPWWSVYVLGISPILLAGLYWAELHREKHGRSAE